jgi:uncharacterized membrane protein
MQKNRLEAFSDGVLAIIITIMVLELKVPEMTQAADPLHDFKPLLPVFLSYVLSFIYVGIYWNNHHHLFQIVKHVNGGILWANLHLLFWLSLVPFATAWMGSHHFDRYAVMFYGIIMFLSAVAYTILASVLKHAHGENEKLSTAIGRDRKGKISLVIYLLGIGLSWFFPAGGILCYLTVALIWLVPDRRIEHVLTD